MHVTNSSSTIIESAAMGIPTLVTGEFSKDDLALKKYLGDYFLNYDSVFDANLINNALNSKFNKLDISFDEIDFISFIKN